MKRRLLPLVLIMVLLTSVFSTGVSAAGVVSKGIPVLTFTPASTTITAQAEGPEFIDRYLGEFKFDGSTTKPVGFSVGVTDLSYEEDGTELLITDVKLVGNKLYASFESPKAPEGKAEAVIKFEDSFPGEGYIFNYTGPIATVSVYTPVTSVSLENPTLTFVGLEEPKNLLAEVNKGGKPAADVEYVWTSSAPAVAEVTPTTAGKAIVTPRAEGTATITVTAKNKAGSKSNTVKVTVSKVESTGVEITDYENIHVDEIVQLKTKIEGPDNHTDKVKSWSSSDTTVATIDSKGVLTPKKEGVTTITVKTAQGRLHSPSVVVGPANTKPSDPKIELSGSLAEPGAAAVISTSTVGAKIYYAKTDDGEEPDLTAENAATAGTLYTGPIAMPENKTYKFKAVAIKGDKASEVVDAEFEVDIAVSSVKLDKTAVTVNGVATVVLTAQVLPAGANVKDITWSPSVPGDGASKVEISNDKKTYKITTIGTEEKVTVKATVKYGKASDKTKDSNECVITVKPVNATSVSASPASLTIPAGETAELKAVVTPANATYQDVDFYYNAASTVIRVEGASEGKVEGKDKKSITIEALTTGVGKSETITIVTKNGLRTTCVVNVVAATKVAAPVFSKANGTVITGAKEADRTITLTSATIGATIKYKLNDGTEQEGYTIVIPENKTSVIVARAVKAGLADSDTVTATFTSATAVEGIELDADVTIDGKKTHEITATLTPESAANKAITWKSSDTSVATVAPAPGAGNELKAVITAVKKGEATITVTTADGGFTDSVKVTVNEPTIDHLAIFDGEDELDADLPLTVNSGESVQLSVKAFGDVEGTTVEVAPFGTPIWTSSDNAIATVNSTGRVTIPDGVASGKEATVKVRLAGKEQTLKITTDTPTSVAPLVFDKAPGSYDEEITVKATTATEGAQIFYTLDGSWPNENSTPFPANGIKLSESTTLRAVAMKGSLSSAYKTADYSISIAVKNVEMEKKTLTITRGDTVTLKAKVTPDNAADATINWSVNDSNVATIDSQGVLTAKKAGTVTVTAKAGAKEDTCVVTIQEVPVTSVILTPPAATLTVGEEKQLIMTVRPADVDGEKKTFVWTSSDATVASVDKAGKVTAKKAGTATITVTVDGVSASSVITVEAAPANIPLEPVKEVTFTPAVKSFKVVEGDSLVKVLGKLQPGDGETMEQINYFTKIEISVKNRSRAIDPISLDVAKDGTVSLFIPDVGSESFNFDYEWKLVPKNIPGFEPSAALMNSGRPITGNEVIVVKKPKAINFTAASVPAIEMEKTEKKEVVVGEITNYEEFVAAKITIKPEISGIEKGATASIDSDGTVTVNLDRPALGQYVVTTTLKATGYSNVSATFDLTVTGEPEPVKKEIVVQAATTPSKGTYKKKPVYILNKNDKTVTFSVPGSTVTKWKSSDTKYLKFGANGVATLKKASSSKRITVTASLSDGSTVKHYVMIRKIATSVKLQYKKGSKWYTFGETPLALNKGSKPYVRVVAKPSGTKIFASRKWVSSDSAIAYYKSGRIYAKGVGLVTFEYELDNGYVAIATINVVSKSSKSAQPKVEVAPSSEQTLEPAGEPAQDTASEPEPSEAPAAEADQIEEAVETPEI